MDDLISRQAAIDAAKDWYEGLICGSINGLIKRLNALPTAQPEHKVRFADKDHVWIDGKQYISLPRFQEAVKEAQPKEGHWIRRDCGLDVECKCSKCGYRDFVEPRDEYWFKRNYCPNCGADMRGGKNG